MHVSQLTNILLTENLEPKLSDFGLAKMLGMEESKVFTDVRGTMGYMDPEYMSNAKLTCASDIYSFGIVTLQLLSGQKVIELDLDSRDQLTRKVSFLCAWKSLDTMQEISRVQRVTTPSIFAGQGCQCRKTSVNRFWRSKAQRKGQQRWFWSHFANCCPLCCKIKQRSPSYWWCLWRDREGLEKHTCWDGQAISPLKQCIDMIFFHIILTSITFIYIFWVQKANREMVSSMSRSLEAIPV